jgi:hypothetical protein
LFEFAIERETRGFGSETFRIVASIRDSEAVAAMAASCTGFSTKGVWIARLSIDSTLFRTTGRGAGEAAAAFAKTEIASFGKLLLKESPVGVDATSGDLKGSFSCATDGIRAVKFNVPCGV